ncbi:hypothetical protein RI543_004309 [Arxiozyma heterogenica]|uniref:Uncharacterized protein n=1 Tax=Arxiozyma heterogenica TaxID=278026 RepID=A0AAN7WLA3_9SACH|nr:hypothetical protein RI543_004309 [Kazachstania heterogenica]
MIRKCEFYKLNKFSYIKLFKYAVVVTGPIFRSLRTSPKVASKRKIPLSSINDNNNNRYKSITRGADISFDLYKVINPSPDSITININVKNTKQELLNVDKLGITCFSKPPELAFGLDRVLYSPVILHQLYDNRSGVYNFDPKVETISPNFLERKVENIIDFGKENKISGGISFITPHKDKNLLKIAKFYSKKYISSTSSMTAVLSHLHFLLSNFRKLNIKNSSVSNTFPHKYYNFTRGAQLSATVLLRRKTNVITSIDSDRSLDREIILSVLGHSLEDFLTTRDLDDKEEHYHYSKIDDFIIRSQLDAYGNRLPGSGIFDLKTRAVVSVRHDLSYVQKYGNFTGYEIDKVYGEFESLEREFFEVIRSALLKYSLQARMGFMDGIFLAYHNIAKIFGFQYLPLEEIDYIIHSGYNTAFKKILDQRQYIFEKIFGQEDFIINHQRNEKEIANKVADSEFKMSIVLLRNVLRFVELKLKERDLNWKVAKVIFKTEKLKVKLKNGYTISYPVLNILAFPLTDEYEDIPLPPISNFEDIDSLKTQLDIIKNQYETLIKNVKKNKSIIGFKVHVLHKQRHHKNSVNLPDYINEKFLSKEERKFVIKEIKKNYYQKVLFDTPNFFHPFDVDQWQIEATITPIHDTSKMVSTYRKYLNEKIEALKFQSFVKETDQSLKSSRISKNIKQLLENTVPPKRKKNVDFNSVLDTEPTEFQNVLRAYSLRCLKKKKHRNIKL